jgi:hypothetical protein
VQAGFPYDDSTVSSSVSGPATPSSSLDPSWRHSYESRRGTPPAYLDNAAAAGAWSPFEGEANFETRRPDKSPTRRHRRYRMSIDASLGPKPVVSQPNPPPPQPQQQQPSSPSNSERMPIPPRLRPSFPYGPPGYDAGPSRHVDDEPVIDRFDREEAREILRRETRERRRSEEKRRVTIIDPAEQQEREGDAPGVVELTQSQEMKEYEERMKDAYELRTADRLDGREQIREENRRRRQEEDRAREMENRRGGERGREEEMEDVEMRRRLAEMAVEDGRRERESLDEAHVYAEKTVLERRVALANMKRRKADNDAAFEQYLRAQEDDQEQKRILKAQIQEGRIREAELQERRRDLFKDFAQGRRKSAQAERKTRAQEMRERIQASERLLSDLEAQIRERKRVEEERRRQILHLEQIVESLDQKIAARERRASMMGRIDGSRMGERQNIAAGPSRSSWNPFLIPPTPQETTAYRRNRGMEVLERDRRNAMAREADGDANFDVRVPETPRRRDTIGGGYRAREKSYRGRTQM